MSANTWEPQLVTADEQLSECMNSLADAVDFYERAMAAPSDGTGVQRDAARWLHDAAVEAFEAYAEFLRVRVEEVRR